MFLNIGKWEMQDCDHREKRQKKWGEPYDHFGFFPENIFLTRVQRGRAKAEFSGLSELRWEKQRLRRPELLEFTRQEGAMRKKSSKNLNSGIIESIGEY